jgi:hypothetical protein
MKMQLLFAKTAEKSLERRRIVRFYLAAEESAHARPLSIPPDIDEKSGGGFAHAIGGVNGFAILDYGPLAGQTHRFLILFKREIIVRRLTDNARDILIRHSREQFVN